MSTIADINVRIGAIIQPLETALGRAESKLKRSGQRMANIGSQLTQTISLPIIGIGIAAIKTAGDFEALENGLISIMGNAEAAAREMDLLRKESLKPGLNLTQAVKGSVRLQSVGVSAEQARLALTNFGNAIALAGGGGAELDSVSHALTKIIAKGKISAEEINMLAESVPQVRKAIQDAFGTGDSEALQKLGISAEEFVQKVTEEMGKLPPATSGIKNAIENVGQGLSMFLVDIGKEINKAFNITALADNFSLKLQAISTAFQGLSDGTKKTILAIVGFAAAIGPVFFVLGKVKLALAAVAGAIKAVFSLSSLKMLLNPWTLAFAALIGIGILIVKNWDVVKKAIVNVINAVIGAYNANLQFRASVQGIIFVFKTLWNTAKMVFQNMNTGFSTLFKAIKKAITMDFDGARAELRNGFQEIFNNSNEIGAQIGEDFSSALTNTIKGKLKNVDESIFEPLEKKLQGLSNSAANIMSNGGAGGGGGAAGGGKAEVKELEDLGFKGLDNSFNTEALTLFSDKLKAMGFIVDEIKPKNDRLKEAIAGYTPIIATVTSAWSKMSDVQKEAFAQAEEKLIRATTAATQFSNALSGIVNSGLQSAFEGIGEAIGAAMGKGQDFGGVLKSIGGAVLGSLVEMLGNVGKLAIATGIAVLGIKTALKTLNPFVAIAAGVALVALSALVKSKLSGGVPGFAAGTDFAPGGLAMVGEKGPELVNLKRGSQVVPNHKLGAMGGAVEVFGNIRVRGDDLILALESAQKTKNRIR